MVALKDETWISATLKRYGSPCDAEHDDCAMRTRPCVRLFCIVDTLTSASVLPGINDIIEELGKRVAFAGHNYMNNMSRPQFVGFQLAGVIQSNVLFE